MTSIEIRTPSMQEITAGVAAGKRARAETLRDILAAGLTAVRTHFEVRASLRQAPLKTRCADCAC